ncbi:hypothetical protein niasHS_007140 [Heterodera schachtii]|uniref:F-box domain-containing protein n=1 Tax=Heterodera schachtii TaxID=97005 RepID=A0ABD2JLB2_HETSC
MDKRKSSERLQKNEVIRRSRDKKVKLEETSNCFTMDVAAHIDKLPDDILLLIFRKLPHLNRLSLEFVCKRWRKLARKFVWADVKMLRLSQWTPQKHKVNKIIERAGKYLRELCLEEIKWHKILNQLTKMPNLQHISLCGKGDVMLEHQHIISIAQCFPNLLSLNLWKCLKNSSHALSELLSKCAAIEYLSLCRATNIGTILFEPTLLPSKLAFLETDDTFDLQAMFKIANEKCRNIRCLSLQFLKPTIPSLDFVHEDTLKRLVHLELDFHKTPQASFFENFVKTSLAFLANLRILRLAKVTGEALLAVIDRCPNLQDLGYSAYNIDILAAFLSLSRLKNLRFLVIRHYGKVLQQISTQKCVKCSENCDETFVGRSLKQIAQNEKLEFLSLNFPISVGLMCKLVRECKCLTSLFCPIVRYQPLASLCQCLTELNQQMNSTSERVDAVQQRKRTLNISVNFQKSRTMSHPFIRFLHTPDFGSDVVRQNFEQLFTKMPSFLCEQPETIDDYYDDDEDEEEMEQND